MSKLQSLVLKQVKEVFPETHFQIRENYRPGWMENKRTGHNLEIDISVHELQGKKANKFPCLAIEVQGEQHFDYVHKFRNNPDKTREYDDLKHKLCSKNKIVLIEVFYFDLKNNFDLLKRLVSSSQALPNNWQRKKLEHLLKLINSIQQKKDEAKKWLEELKQKDSFRHGLPSCFDAYLGDQVSRNLFGRRMTTL